jgi:hypothetical protein
MGIVGNTNWELEHSRNKPVESIHVARDSYPRCALPARNVAHPVSCHTWYTRISSVWATQEYRQERRYCHYSTEWHTSTPAYWQRIFARSLSTGTRRRKIMGRQRIYAPHLEPTKKESWWDSNEELHRRHSGQLPELDEPRDLRRLERQGR